MANKFEKNGIEKSSTFDSAKYLFLLKIFPQSDWRNYAM
jgi:hypothetical protein